MTYCVEEIHPVEFKLKLIDDKKQINIKLQFMIDEEKT